MTQEVHVVMPTRNAGRFIGEAISSVIDQSHEHWKLVIVDGASTDNTLAVARHFGERDSRIKVISKGQPDGIARGHNDGFAGFSSDFLAFLDSDNRWLPSFLESQLAFLSSNGEANAVAADSWIIDGRGRRKGIRGSAYVVIPAPEQFGTTEALVMQNHIITDSIVIRGAAAKTLKFNERLPYLNDWLYWIELSLRGRIRYNPEPLVEYRQHNSNVSAGRRTLDTGLVEFADELEKVLGPTQRSLEYRLEYYRLRGHEALGELPQALASLVRMIRLSPLGPKNLAALAHFLPFETRLPTVPHIFGRRFQEILL